MNISKQLAESLDRNQLDAIRLIGSSCDLKQVKAFLVGGTVRDVVLGGDVRDIDIAMECHPRDVTNGISSNTELKVISESTFGTQKVEIGDVKIDLAMTRTEEYSDPSVLPNVSLSVILEDLKRRDFTANSIAMSISHACWGQVLDPMNGLLDIQKKQIRVLHDKSFEDDPTRIFRAVRYAKRLGFTINPSTDKLMTDSVRYMRNLSGSRIVNELACVYLEPCVVSILKELVEYNVLENIKKNWVLTDRMLSTVRELTQCTLFDVNSFLVVLAAGFNEIDREDLCFRLNLDNVAKKAILDFSILETFHSLISRSELYNKLKPCSISSINAGKFFLNKSRSDKISLFLDELINFKLEIDGNDLLSLGVEQGPEVGEFLKLLRDAALDHAIIGKIAQLELAEKLLAD